MIVSRRSAFLAGASSRLMRAAGRAASTEALQRLAQKQAQKQHDELMAKNGMAPKLSSPVAQAILRNAKPGEPIVIDASKAA
jgi:hypothetical protein